MAQRKPPQGVETTSAPSAGIYRGRTTHSASSADMPAVKWVARLVSNAVGAARRQLTNWRAISKSLRSHMPEVAHETPLIVDDPRLARASAAASTRRKSAAGSILERLNGIEDAIHRGDDAREIAARAYWLGREVERFNVLDFEPFAGEGRKISEGRTRRKSEGRAKAQRVNHNKAAPIRKRRDDAWVKAADRIRLAEGPMSKAALIRKVLRRVDGISEPTPAVEKRVRRVLDRASRIAG